jgi:hypothetical protein
VAEELVITVAAVERHATTFSTSSGMRQLPEHHRRVLALLTYLRA